MSVVIIPRGRSRTAATFKMERFLIIVNSWNLLTIITKRSILDVSAVLDTPLIPMALSWKCPNFQISVVLNWALFA